MEPKKLPPERVDELGRRLQGSLQRERPRWGVIALVVLAVGAALGWLAWLLYPGPEPPRLEVIALDGLSAAGATPRAQAYLALPEHETEYDASVLRGREVIFADAAPALAPGGDAGRTKKATTDAHARAAVDWPGAAPGKPASFQARYINVQRRHGSNDDATLFVASGARPRLVVDVEETLAKAPPEQWAALHPAAIGGQAGAGAALQKLAGKYEVVYLTVHAAQPIGYRKVRGWVGSKRGGPDGLPPGPVLGRMVYPGPAGADEARRDALRDLKSRFGGTVVAIVGTPASAAVAREAGLQTVLVGAGEAGDGVPRVPQWSDVGGKLLP
jgi:hypothetical protein